MSPLPPHWYEVVIGCLAVIGGALLAAWALWVVRHTRNWLLLIVGIGALLFVAGVAGQQAPAGPGIPGNAWTASIVIPLLGIAVSGVAVAGLLAVLVGVSLSLFFERVIPEEARWRPQPPRPLDEDDAV